MKAIPVAIFALVAACGTVENVSAQQVGRPSNIYIAEMAITQEAQPSPSDAQANSQAPHPEGPAVIADSIASGAPSLDSSGGQAGMSIGGPCSPCDPGRTSARCCCGTSSCRPCGGGLFGRCRLGRRW